MEFRTQIEVPRTQPLQIAHSNGVVMLGSCFTDNIGTLMQRDGFDVVHNPMGPLYNPASILNALELALDPARREGLMLRDDPSGTVHCLDFASRYSHSDRKALIDTVTADLDDLGARLRQADTVILTLGTAYVFEIGSRVVGNCHKFPADTFVRRRLALEETVAILQNTLAVLPDSAQVIFTVSPIRHTADGLHVNQLSKALLQMAVDSFIDNERVHYFPAYEIMLDDLRDYRFYTADMKHPSDVAVEYIYDIFSKYYFNAGTVQQAQICRKQYLRQAHRQIL